MVIGALRKQFGFTSGPEKAEPAAQATAGPVNPAAADSRAAMQAMSEAPAKPLDIVEKDNLAGTRFIQSSDELGQALEGKPGAEKMVKAAQRHKLGEVSASGIKSLAVVEKQNGTVLEILPPEVAISNEFKTGISAFFSKIFAWFGGNKSTNGSDFAKNGWIELANSQASNSHHESVSELKRKIKSGEIIVVKMTKANEKGELDPNKPSGYMLLHDAHAIMKKGLDNSPSSIPEDTKRMLADNIKKSEQGLGRTYIADAIIGNKELTESFKTNGDDALSSLGLMAEAAAKMIGAENTMMIVSEKPMITTTDVVRGPEHAYVNLSGIKHLEQKPDNPKELEVREGNITLIRALQNMGKPIDGSAITAAEMIAHMDSFTDALNPAANFEALMESQQSIMQAIETFNSRLAASQQQAAQTQAMLGTTENQKQAA